LPKANFSVLNLQQVLLREALLHKEDSMKVLIKNQGWKCIFQQIIISTLATYPNQSLIRAHHRHKLNWNNLKYMKDLMRSLIKEKHLLTRKMKLFQHIVRDLKASWMEAELEEISMITNQEHSPVILRKGSNMKFMKTIKWAKIWTKSLWFWI